MEGGREDAAEVAVPIIDAVVAEQWTAPGQPWDAGFGGRPRGRIAWVDGWDPNLRPLVGLMLGVASDVLGPRRAWTEALVRAVLTEESLHRLPPSYGNIAAAHAAAAFSASALSGDPALAATGGRWLRAIETDVDERGGWCEHASPTYAGVCLAALAGAARWAPAGPDRDRAEVLARRAAAELTRAWNPAARDLIGPFGRAYHVRGADHVAVSGLALAAGGVDGAAPEPAARHPEDWGWAGVVSALQAGTFFGPARSEWSPADRVITGFGSVTQVGTADGGLAWGALNGKAVDWHHQTVTASMHGGGAAAWVWHPAVSAQASAAGWSLTPREPGDGLPAWLWGGLERPDRPTRAEVGPIGVRFSREPVLQGRAVTVPGAFTLSFEEPPRYRGLVKDGQGPPGYEVSLPFRGQDVGIAAEPAR